MNKVIKIEGQQFNLVKKGYSQAVQLTQIGAWLSKYGLNIATKVTEFQKENENANGTLLLLKVLDAMTPEALIDLFTVSIGCDHDFAMENYDTGTLVDAAIVIYNNQPAIQKAINRFFLQPAPTKIPDSIE